MKTAAIFYFSGTGTTERVAKMLRDALVNQDCNVDLYRIEDILNQHLPIETEKYDLIGIGSQVIGYGTPQIVLNFIRALPRVERKATFIFRTAGGVAPINYNASKPMIRRLRRKGYQVFHERIFSIASNWISRFNDQVVRDLYAATRKKTALMAKEVLLGQERFYQTDLWLRLPIEALMVVNPLIFKLVGKDLRVAKTCKHCGLCIRRCPLQNIYEKDGQVKFKFSCNSCLRCVYACPNHAIQFSRFTAFPIPGGYDLNQVLNTAPDEPGFSAGAIPPFLDHYLRDDQF